MGLCPLCKWDIASHYENIIMTAHGLDVLGATVRVFSHKNKHLLMHCADVRWFQCAKIVASGLINFHMEMRMQMERSVFSNIFREKMLLKCMQKCQK